jgi:hypothetical protein
LPNALQAEGQWARGQILQPSLRMEEPTATGTTLRTVRGNIPAEEGRSEAVLFEGVRDEVGGAAQAQAEQDGSWLHLSAGTRQPDGVQAGLCDGTSPSDRGRSSHQRSTPRQPNREPASHASIGTQPASEADNIVSDRVPLLQGETEVVEHCPHCAGRLIRRERPGVVLDCFAGTGTTGEAAWREGFNAILIEREPEYQADIARRMDLAVKPAKRAAVAKTKGKLMGAEGTPLFGDAA